MRDIKAYFGVQLKNMGRAPFLKALFILLWLYCSLIYIRALPEKEPLFMIQNGYYGQAVAMLLFMYAGMALAQYEQRREIMLGSGRSGVDAMRMCLAKIALLFAGIMAFVLAVYGSNAIAYCLLGQGWAVHRYAARMFLARYLLPVMICGVLGIALGMQCTSRLKYALVILLWGLINPLSIEVTAYLSETLGSDLKRWEYFFSVLSVGARMQTGPTPVYGVTYSTYQTMLLGWKLLASVAYCVTTAALRGERPAVRYGFQIAAVSALVWGLMGSYSLDHYKTMVYGSIPEERRAGYEYKYYGVLYDSEGRWIHPDEPGIQTDQTIEAVKCRVNMEVGRERMGVKAVQDYRAAEETDAHIFTLYRDFEVNALLFNDEPVDFERTGDYVFVRFPESVAEGQSFSLSWVYSGTSSPIFPANRDAVYLSACFPWLPEAGMRLPLPVSDRAQTDLYVLYAGSKAREPVEYELSFASPYTAYVNLPKTGENTWSGASSDGLTIFSDRLMTCKTIDALEVYYPATVEREIDAMTAIALYTERVKRDMLHAVDYAQEKPARLVVSPVMPAIEAEGVIRNYTMHGDVLLCFETPFFVEGYVSRYAPEEIAGLWDREEPDRMAAEDAIDSIRNQPAFIEAAAYDPVNRLLGDYLLLHDWTRHHLVEDAEIAQKWRDRAGQRADEADDGDWDELLEAIETRLKRYAHDEDEALTVWFDWVMQGRKPTGEDVLMLLKGGQGVETGD